MPVRALPHDHVTADLRAQDLEWVGRDTAWFDAHTHIGHNDPDGYEADPHELVEALDAAGQHKALVFAMHEPDGYREANAWVLRACAESDGRLVALVRIDPNAPDALDEARRGLHEGERGFKLHPRSDDFGLPHGVVEQVVELASEHRLPVLFHA
ncbi:MAG TPA: amidohydrolase family protein, partial [Solirubrobacteraceae bacterium]